jgi:hypothetical protein
MKDLSASLLSSYRASSARWRSLSIFTFLKAVSNAWILLQFLLTGAQLQILILQALDIKLECLILLIELVVA